MKIPTIEELDNYAFVTSGDETLLGTCGQVAAPFSTMLTNAIVVNDAWVVLGGYAPNENKTIGKVRVYVPLENMFSAHYKIVVPEGIFPLVQLNTEDRRRICAELNVAVKGFNVARAKSAGILLP